MIVTDISKMAMIVKFGVGDIGVGDIGVGSEVAHDSTLYNSDGVGKLTFKQLSKKYPIATPYNGMEDIDKNINPSIFFEFTKVESVDVVIKNLEHIKKHMMAIREKTKAESYTMCC